MTEILQALVWLICIHLILRSVHIFQIALISNSDQRWMGLIIGATTIAASVFVSLELVDLANKYAQTISTGVRDLAP